MCKSCSRLKSPTRYDHSGSVPMDTDDSLLAADSEGFYDQLLLQAREAALGGDALAGSAPYQSLLPKPGFCLKTRTDKDEKIFINICHAENVPQPKDMSDEALLKLLESDDPGGYRIPMSLGEPHAEVDNKGAGCTAYDVVVNPEFFKQVKERQILLGFFLTVVIEGLEYKNNITLDRNWKMLKNRRFVGSLPEQNIRKQSKPLIMEMNDSGQPVNTKPSALISEIGETRTKSQEPPYTIMAEPPTGHPEFLVAEIHIPKVKSAATVTLDVGEDRVVVTTRSNIYHLDIYLPYLLLQEHACAQFNANTKVLTVTLPVQSNG